MRTTCLALFAVVLIGCGGSEDSVSGDVPNTKDNSAKAGNLSKPPKDSTDTASGDVPSSKDDYAKTTNLSKSPKELMFGEWTEVERPDKERKQIQIYGEGESGNLVFKLLYDDGAKSQRGLWKLHKQDSETVNIEIIVFEDSLDCTLVFSDDDTLEYRSPEMTMKMVRMAGPLPELDDIPESALQTDSPPEGP